MTPLSEDFEWKPAAPAHRPEAARASSRLVTNFPEKIDERGVCFIASFVMAIRKTGDSRLTVGPDPSPNLDGSKDEHSACKQGRRAHLSRRTRPDPGLAWRHSPSRISPRHLALVLRGRQRRGGFAILRISAHRSPRRAPSLDTGRMRAGTIPGTSARESPCSTQSPPCRVPFSGYSTICQRRSTDAQARRLSRRPAERSFVDRSAATRWVRM